MGRSQLAFTLALACLCRTAAPDPPRNFHAVIVRPSLAPHPSSSVSAADGARPRTKVSTSRYWFNYRHTTNALTIYQRLRRSGVPDSNIGSPQAPPPPLPPHG